MRLSYYKVVNCNSAHVVKISLVELKPMVVAAGEAYHSCEAKDTMADRESLFAIDGVTTRADCDANYDFDNANKLNLIPVCCF